MLITIAHAREALGKGNPSACNKGIRIWCKANSIDLKSFLLNGLELSEHDANLIQDPIARKIVEVAKNGR